MKSKLIYFFFFNTFLFASGGYDNGSSAGKGLFDFSLTINPFNYFDNGQSYIIIGYGINDQIDFQTYYSYLHNGKDNYYFGALYQFYESNRLDLSTAIGIRKYTNETKSNFFIPQLLYNLKINNRLSIGGSFVNIREKNKNLGVAKDIFMMFDFYENNEYKLGFTFGGFNPVLWEPDFGEWYPTYSFEVKIK